MEEYYGTDKEKEDTDGDGLSDYIEIVILGTTPLSPISDESGVLDTELDSDSDGINNGQEMKLGTNPGDDDTDADGINDEKELELSTDPLNYDTDRDGASDGWEVQMGADPLVADVAFEVTYTSEYRDTVKPSVEIVLSGSQVDTLAVDPIVGNNLFPVEMPGYIGLPYNFSVDGEFDTATISFEYDPLQMSEDAEPTIYYFNEAEQKLEELITTVSGNVASAKVDHFSTYILLDRKAYNESFTWEDTWKVNSAYSDIEIVFVIDDSGSMGPIGSNNDPNNKRLTVVSDLIDKLPDNSKIGIIGFSSSAKILTPELTSDKGEAKSYLTTDYFLSSGKTYMYYAIRKAFSLYQSADEDTLKVMVVLSDGGADDEYRHETTIDLAKTSGIKIYTVSLGSVFKHMKELAEQTGGGYYYAANASKLASIYEDINKKIELSTDSDDDGIPDYYEENMVAFNGLAIDLDKDDNDSDDDGLLDGQEIEVKIEYSEDKKKVRVRGKIISLPDNPDSDNDGIGDKDDPTRMEYTITERTISMIEGLSYSNLSAYVGLTLGEAIENGAVIKNISDEHIKYLKDAIIVHANDSGNGYWKDFWDSGLGFVALKFVRSNKPTSVVFALRGTEPDSDLANDAFADLMLGIGWDTEQSRNAFKAYKEVATNKNYDYYIAGHSLGGRLAQDVLYKIYNANEGGLFKKIADIPTPVHSATFNALGYNRVIYMTLENDLLKSYESKLVNFYYWLDLVGEGLGASLPYKHAGTDVMLTGKDIDGNYLRDDRYFDNIINIRDIKYHDILYFHSDYDLLYTSPHTFAYWAK